MSRPVIVPMEFFLYRASSSETTRTIHECSLFFEGILHEKLGERWSGWGWQEAAGKMQHPTSNICIILPKLPSSL
jgi:hypothetical protein